LRTTSVAFNPTCSPNVVRGGGVGYYPVSDFVHVDTGRVRTW
jgi:uncharacterized protein YcbK (DUF882 family)